jgi:UDPglucose--hexose-1-phosphate uridylyltransferase
MHRRELSEECAFCADLTTGRVPANTQTWIRHNDFPPFRPPQGECYILIYHPEHNRTFAGLTPDEVTRVVALWQEIYDRLSPRYPAVMSWETSGAEIGQTQYHPHGQAFGLSVVPDTLARELAAVERALAAGEGCPFCAEVARESGGPRVVVDGEHWLAYVPEYARFPYQVHLVPRRHVNAVAGLDRGGTESAELARMLLTVVKAYNRVYQAPMPYMLALHQLADERFHFHIELLPVGRSPGKLKYAASSESAWGFWINDSLPDDKAEELRAAIGPVAEPIPPTAGDIRATQVATGQRRELPRRGGQGEQQPGASQASRYG